MNKYRILLKKFLNIKDEWGGIDEKILKAVVVLNYLNIKTSGSCEGHLNSLKSPLPWIKISSNKYKNKILKLIKEFYKTRKFKSKEIKLTITFGKNGFWLHSNKKLFKKWRNFVEKNYFLNKNKKITKNHNLKLNFKITKKDLKKYQKEFNEFANFLIKNFNKF